MLVLLALLGAGPLAFLEQPLPEVRIGPVVPFTGKPTTNYVHSDMNADGQTDLVLDSGVLLQDDGTFPENGHVALPGHESTVEADVFGGTLYYRTADRLSAFTYGEHGWRRVLDQPLDWPGSEAMRDAAPGLGNRVIFRRFAYDVDGDNTPELIALDGEGLHVFRQSNGQFESGGLFDVLPAVVLAPTASQAIWPGTARQIVLPDRQMSCRLLIEPNALSLINQTNVDGEMGYQRSIMSLQRNGGGFAISDTTSWQSPALPAHVRPCHLNNDATLDFAGSRWLISDTTPVPMPILEISVSLDGGRTFQFQRVPCFQHFRPQCNFLDIDSDGDLDLVMEATTLYDSGVRETVNQYLTRSELPHQVRVYPQEAGSFTTEPAFVYTVEFDLKSPPIVGGAMLSRYQSGKLLNLTGDFNGDGFLDLVLRTSEDRLRIHLSLDGNGFDTNPAARIEMPSGADFSVADINDDGRADILLVSGGNGGESITSSAYLSRSAR